MIMKIEALDTLFFRDGKSFDKGEDAFANVIFPPYPGTLYGALRSAWFAAHPDRLSLANTADDPTAGLCVKSIFLIADGTASFPLPGNLVHPKAKGENVIRRLQPSELRDGACCRDLPFLLADQSDEIVETISGGLLAYDTYNDFLRGGSQEIGYFLLENYLVREPKTGIARDRRTGSSAEHMLYQAAMVRPQARGKDILGIGIEFEHLTLPESGFLRLGGEAKGARYEPYTGESHISYPELQGRDFSLTLATPAIFANGWLPGGIDPVSLEGEIAGVPVKLLTAVTGKPLSVGGFDMKGNKPKPMHRAVPSGAVYYWRISEDFPLQQANEQLRNRLHSQMIADSIENINYASQGYGLAFVGRAS